MAHWFHRNQSKATTACNFDLKIDKPTDATKKICSDLKLSRSRLLDLITDAGNSKETIEIAFTAYLGLLYGLIWEIESYEESSKRVGRPNPSKLRNIFVFKWTNSIIGRTTHSSADSVYEAASISVNVAFWLMRSVAKDSVSMEEAKIIHSTLRQAAGILTFVQTEFLPQLSSPPPLGSDLDPRVINAYINQCTAEAQEITVARAVEMKQNASLISALANETSKLFLDASNTLKPFKQEVSLKWIKYLELKSEFYLAYAYCYCGENLLNLDKGGASIRALLEANNHYKRSVDICQLYEKIKAPTGLLEINHHQIFQRFKIKMQMTLDKCQRENNLIYHDEIPNEVPILDKKATFGLVSPIDFQMAPANPLWNQTIYNTLTGNKKCQIDKEFDLPPVQEINNSNHDKKIKKGCTTQ